MTDSAMVKKNRRPRWIALLALAALIACAAAGYGYWHQLHRPTATLAKAAPPAAPVFWPLETFTVNLGDADRVLYIGITLRLKDEATRARLNEYLPEVRSRLLLLFSRQDAAALASDSGKLKLIEAIKQTLGRPLVPGQPGQVVTDVLYTAFILR